MLLTNIVNEHSNIANMYTVIDFAIVHINQSTIHALRHVNIDIIKINMSSIFLNIIHKHQLIK